MAIASSARPTPPALPARPLGLVILHLASYAASASAAAWIVQPAGWLGWAGALLAALALELLCFALKERIYTAGPLDVSGWGGVLVDGLVNAGGILPFTDRLLTLPALAALLELAGLNVASGEVRAVGGLLVAGLLGLALSLAPHRLWRR